MSQPANSIIYISKEDINIILKHLTSTAKLNLIFRIITLLDNNNN